MFEYEIETNWKENLKDKMITFVDLYRKHYKEPIKDMKYKREYHENYRTIITYEFKDVDITFESVEDNDTKWMSLSIYTDNDDKKFFDERYDFITKTIKEIK